jgi:hypothetical protein
MMAKFARKLTIFSFFSFFLLFAIMPVFGGGGQDRDLARADELIRNREHDEAILVLTDFARRNPDKFDQAQQRLRRIYQIRDEFNRIADELIETLLNDPGNNERIFQLSTRLYALENENSPLLVNFVSRTMEIAQFNLNRIRLRTILERGRNFLDLGDTLAAIQTYAEGMDIMRDEFFAAGYGAEIENEALRHTANINSVVANFRQVSSEVGTISAELTRAVNAQDINRINDASNRLAHAMDRFIALKQNLYTASSVFDRILNVLRTNFQETGDRNNLAFINTVIHGRTDETMQEGMLGAFDTHWNNTVNPALEAFISYIARTNSEALAAFNAGEYTAVAVSLRMADTYINMTPLFFDKHRQLFAGTKPQTVTADGSSILDADMHKYLQIRALYDANNLIRQAASIAANLNIDRSSLANWQRGNINAAQALGSEQQTRSALVGMQRSINEITTQANQANTEIYSRYNIVYISNTLNVIENFQTVLHAEEVESAFRYYTIAQDALQNQLAERRIQLEEGRALLSGRDGTNEYGEGFIYHYPNEALQILNTMLASLAINLEDGNSVLSQYRDEQPQLSANEGISSTRVKHQLTVDELNSLRTQGLALAETARTRSAQAETFRQDGERLFRDAQASFQRQNYDAAREQIERAHERFFSSLQIQYSDAVRQMMDTQLSNLDNEINTAENQIIVVEVRDLINAARNLYYAGNLQQAEERLTRARNLWRRTNTEPNVEVDLWLGLVHTALAASSGRVIPPTAPLYMEMSQLLSEAQRNFEEGVRLINAGQRTQGTARFEEARQLTREVKLLFPINQEAGLLDLRIEQFLDPGVFNASFEQRLNTARAGTRQRSMEAFADLQNLAEINPNYPNMRAILTQAEYDMGFRPPPPDPATVAYSMELTVSARRIIDTNQTTQFQSAMLQLNEAIRLHPENTEASRLRDRLSSMMNSPGTIVLSVQDEAEFQRALRELQAGNLLAAMSIVNRLLQNPRNRSVAKLVELERRIRTMAL